MSFVELDPQAVNVVRRGYAALLVAATLVCLSSCSEVRGRRLLQKANQHYRNGQYPEAVAAFTEAEQFVPDLWLLWLNKGTTCRSMLIPGARTPQNEAAMKCALEAFKRFQVLKPEDQRGPALYVQTLFDADQFEILAKLYQEHFQKDPKDVEALNGLISVYAKWPNHLDEALQWHRKKVELRPADAEAHYSAGVFIWQQLFTRGGGADKASFDPRPDPNKPRQVKVSPAAASYDLVGQQRVDMADEGIKLLEKAVELRPKYQEAMAYANLLYRQKSYAYFHQPDEWQKSVDKAAEWRNRTLLAIGKPIPRSGTSVPSAGAAQSAENTGAPASEPLTVSATATAAAAPAGDRKAGKNDSKNESKSEMSSRKPKRKK